jgi:hypothetical protein
MISIIEALEVNFKIRLDYDLTSFEKENYKNKIKNLILSQYNRLSNVDAENWLLQMEKHRYMRFIREIWTQLETDLIYQLTIAGKPDKVMEDMSLNCIENNVNSWLKTYNNYYRFDNQNRFKNEIIMTYPPLEIIEQNKEEQKIHESMRIKTSYKPYAKDLIEDEKKLGEFRRSMKDTSFWGFVLKEYYSKELKNKTEDIELIFKPDSVRKQKEILDLKQELERNDKVKKKYTIKEFEHIDDLLWKDITFYFHYITSKHHGEDRITTLLEVKVKTKQDLMSTRKKELSYFGFESRSIKKDSILFQILKELYEGENDFLTDKYSKLRDHNKCNRFCYHLRLLFPNIKDKRPLPKYRKDQFPEPKFFIVDRYKEKAETELRQHDLNEDSSRLGSYLYDELLN